MKYLITMSRDEGENPKDFLYSDYVVFFEKLGLELIFLPNETKNLEKYFNNFSIQGIILSGGNDLSEEFIKQNKTDIRNASFLRDNIEKKLLDLAVKNRVPVLGICRGMQFINCYFEGQITQNIEAQDIKIKKHINNKHKIYLSDEQIISLLNKDTLEVNSYHHQGIKRDQLSEQLKIAAMSTDDDIVEALYHPLLPIAAIQWHPERNGDPRKEDVLLINSFQNKTLYWEGKRK